jgi:hypothetical protein
MCCVLRPSKIDSPSEPVVSGASPILGEAVVVTFAMADLAGRANTRHTGRKKMSRSPRIPDHGDMPPSAAAASIHAQRPSGSSCSGPLANLASAN